jgi:hypothetical protein
VNYGWQQGFWGEAGLREATTGGARQVRGCEERGSAVARRGEAGERPRGEGLGRGSAGARRAEAGERPRGEGLRRGEEGQGESYLG